MKHIHHDMIIEWAADPDRVFITLTVFLAGMFLGLLVAPYWL